MLNIPSMSLNTTSTLPRTMPINRRPLLALIPREDVRIQLFLTAPTAP